jgi:ribosomal protein S18 acetylase RimI-like enzyme
MTVTLVPMTQAQFDEYRLTAVRDYAQSFVDAGSLSPEAAAERSETDFERLLGDGLDSVGELLFVAYDGDDAVGMIWLHIPDSESAEPAAVDAFVYDVSVHEDKRRRGYGRAIMERGIELCRSRGVHALGLNVFGHNHDAKALYDQLGFQVTSTQMKLTL